ncbi:probable ATP-dependent RNA helicase DHX34 isoform X2 [Dysidea avara]
MSATINIQLFSSYFNDAPVAQVPGRLFPIEVEYCPVVNPLLKGTSSKPEKMDSAPYIRIMERIDHKYPATERGDLLVFVSGMKEISILLEKAKEYAQLTRRWIILPLHSALSIEEQDRVFDVPPDGVRKCIISTNIAETSITIDGVRFIVDSGKVKEMGYDAQAKMRRLQEFWISKASAEQRKGRAGRTGPGVCYRMYSEADYEAFPSYSTPEIQRVPLDSLILQTVALGLGNPRTFPLLESPSLASIETSMSFLKEQGALTNDEHLTLIGRMLAQLPVDVVMGKMLIMATVFNVVDVVLAIAAGLSVQSPFHRAAMREEQARLARRPLESDHGDPFTLLNAFDEWIQVKTSSGSHSSLKWCKRHGLEQQRLYEMTKLQQQFQEILRDANLFTKDEDYAQDSYHTKSSSRERRKELKELRKRKYGSQHKRKMLKMDGEGGVISDDDGDVSIDNKDQLRDMEFKLTHDLTQLQEACNTHRHFTRKDINLLKVVLCSGLYPQLAIPDECNSWRRDSEQVYHTKTKQFVLLHPSSVFSSSPELLEQHVRESQYRDGVELLAYVDLLETDKPYLVNVLRTPALPTLTLFGRSIDTNSDCSRVIVDSWLEIHFQNSSDGVGVLAAVQKLRSTMTDLLEIKLELNSIYRHDNEQDEDDNRETLFTKQRQVNKLTDLLSNKLSEFLSSSFPYSLKRVPSTHVANLYKGSTADSGGSYRGISLLITEGEHAKPVQHSTKGGYVITDYLTYDCLVDRDTVASSSSTPYLKSVWHCPDCEETFVFSLADRLQHQSVCKAAAKPSSHGSDSLSVHREEYFCAICCSHFHFTKPELLQHRQRHKSSTNV